jgi:uncharacterized heparinase superfamily protein
MTSGVSKVTVTRKDDPGGPETVTASHDGYLAAFGLIHERDIGVLNGGRIIRGRDRLAKADGSDPEPGSEAIAVARFHIHPAVGIRQNSAREIFLTAPDGEIWLFACQDGELAVEEDIFFADASGIRTSSQLTVTFALAKQPEIQWTFSRTN